MEGQRSERISAVESAGGSFFSSAGVILKPEAGRPGPERRRSERTSAFESAAGSFFFHRQAEAQIEAGKLEAQIKAPAVGLAIHDAPKGGLNRRTSTGVSPKYRPPKIRSKGNRFRDDAPPHPVNRPPSMLSGGSKTRAPDSPKYWAFRTR